MALLNKDQILTADDLDVQDVEVPEWGGTVRVRALTGLERDRFEMSTALARKNGSTDINLRAAVVARAIVDEQGERIFSDAEATALGRKSGAALDRLFDLVRNMSGMSDEKLKAAAENFANAPNGSSPTA